MRLTKMFGLAMLAAVAAMAFVGAGSASASINELTACKVHQTLCLSGNILREVSATATNPILLGTLNQKCKSSKAVFKEEGLPTTTSIGGSVTELTFTGCEPCTSITTTPPYKANVSGNHLTSGGSATFTNCPFGINCKFGAASVLLELQTNAEGLVTTVVAKEEPLTLEEGSKFFCGSTGKWDATYTVATPFLLVSQRQVP